jgi:ADP-heptose:LPS heptosyltransferase
MRILVSPLDSLTDLVLRQPLFAALSAAGHELMLLIRPRVAPLVPQVAAGARVLHLAHDPHSPQIQEHPGSLDPIIQAVQAFHPDFFLVCGDPATPFDAHLAERLPLARIHGRRGVLTVQQLTGEVHDQARVMPRSGPTAELRTGELLAAAVLGHLVTLPDPRIASTTAQLQAGEAELARHGLRAGEFWAVGLADCRHEDLAGWRAEAWASVLAAWAKNRGRRFLFVDPGTQAILTAMGEASRHATAVDEGVALDTQLGLLHHAAGYIGEESDAMHLAAALGKPVIAVFGGGRWPRFVPAVDPSCALTVGVACAGCNGVCHLAEPHCVTQIPVESVVQAIEDMEAGRIPRRETRVLGLDSLVAARMMRESAATAHDRLLQIGSLRRELAARHDDEQHTEQKWKQQQEALNAREEQLVDREIEMKARYGAQLIAAQEEVNRAEARTRDLQIKLEQLEREHAALRKYCEKLRGDLGNMEVQVNELSSSRWRKIGMKIGIAKPTSWERTQSHN